MGELMRQSAARTIGACTAPLHLRFLSKRGRTRCHGRPPQRAAAVNEFKNVPAMYFPRAGKSTGDGPRYFVDGGGDEPSLAFDFLSPAFGAPGGRGFGGPIFSQVGAPGVGGSSSMKTSFTWTSAMPPP